ncbi:MAG TPA: alpha/beta fold hydrolase [Coriobacteriia bacterium]|nr:alpha/beta fold hydrolase [Coriobacteriia bacterium]
MSQTDLSSLRLNVRHDSGDGPLFVLLHGINANASDWQSVINRIGPEYRCIAVDLLGFGDSPKPLDIDYTADDHALVLHNTLRDLGIRERFVLAGYSLGGDIAIRYASRHPECLRRLFLLSAPFYLPAGAISGRNFGGQVFSEMLFHSVWNMLAHQKKRNGVIYRMAEGQLESFAKAFLKTDDISQNWEIMSKNLENTIIDATFVDDLPKLSMPTVFALGVRDPIVRPDLTPSLKALKPDIEIRRINGLSADHFMLDNLPERVAEELLRDEVTELGIAFHEGNGPGVVLVPGITGEAESLEPMGKALALENDVMIVDLLGFGRSPVPLSSHYTLEDHVAALVSTIEHHFGAAPVRIAGYGFGATVALGCAALRPRMFVDVTAYSPVLLPPGTTVAEATSDPLVARIVANREEIAFLARDPRAQVLNGERLEARTVPPVRSYDSALEVDAASLLDRVKTPTRFVVPDGDKRTPRGWLASVVEKRAEFEIAEPHGTEKLPFERVADALSVMGGITQSQLYAASVAKPPKPAQRPLLESLVGTANSQLVRRGTLHVAAGALLLAVPRIPPRVVTLGFALWLLVEAIQTVVGAFGLRRTGKQWLPWMLIAAVSTVFAAVVAARDMVGFVAVGLVISWGLLARGIADLVVAWQLKDLALRRWALGIAGTLAIVLFALIWLVPDVGNTLLRYGLGGYLVATGLDNLFFGWRIHRATKKRIAQFLAEHPVPKSRRH